jgi:hypothetical protein
MGTALRHLNRNAEAAQAYQAYLEHADADPRRREELRLLLDELGLRTATLHITLRTPGATVRLDDKVIVFAGAEHVVRVDPGEHTIVVQKLGFRTAVRSITAEPGAEVRLPISLLALDEPPPPPVVVVQQGNGDTQRMLGYVLGAFGLGGLTLGAVYGGLALSNDAAAADHCRDDVPEACDAEGANYGQTASTQGTVSMIALVGGAALLGTGIAVWVTAPQDEAPAAAPLPEPKGDPKPRFSASLRLGPVAGVDLRAQW